MKTAWRFSASDGGDGIFPSGRLAQRSAQPAVSIDSYIRGNAPAFNLVGPGVAADYHQFWVGHAFSGEPGVVNDFDDLVAGFELWNFDPVTTQRGGILDLYDLRIEEISPDDPNI